MSHLAPNDGSGKEPAGLLMLKATLEFGARREQTELPEEVVLRDHPDAIALRSTARVLMSMSL